MKQIKQFWAGRWESDFNKMPKENFQCWWIFFRSIQKLAIWKPVHWRKLYILIKRTENSVFIYCTCVPKRIPKFQMVISLNFLFFFFKYFLLPTVSVSNMYFHKEFFFNNEICLQLTSIKIWVLDPQQVLQPITSTFIF